MIVLDTSALIRWVFIPEKLSKKARKTITETLKKEDVHVSSITIWEISLLIKKGRIDFFIDKNLVLEKIESLPKIKFIPVDNKIAKLSVYLPDFFHKDPADRIIIATSLQFGATLITSDKRILSYPQVKTAW